MNSRDAILARIRAGLGVRADDGDRRAAVEAALARPPAPLPAAADDLATRFRLRAAAQSATVDVLALPAEVPAAVARYLAAQGLPPRAACWQQLATLDWAAAGIAAEARAADGDDSVGITGCFCAIAETGTLLLPSGPETAATTSLLPETHIAIVPASRIVPAMEDAFALLRREHGTLPRALNFVSGPSRTGDIEQTLVIGAHGPCRVHLIVVLLA